MVELRRHNRAPLSVQVEFVLKGSNERIAGHARDISVGGMFIITSKPLPFSSEIIVHMTLPPQKTPFALPGVVRWTRQDGMGVQFGLVGARETHAITQITRST